ncbi:hypothetical protein QUF80_00445 [Desulfococcaceae bacterium HSG8]|nr:hypothetical protein [Desulfococcaceae bacterium HSG8]
MKFDEKYTFYDLFKRPIIEMMMVHPKINLYSDNLISDMLLKMKEDYNSENSDILKKQLIKDIIFFRGEEYTEALRLVRDQSEILSLCRACPGTELRKSRTVKV